MAVQQLAADLARRLPWLARGHIGTLCDALITLGLDATGWTGADIVEHLDADNAAAGRYQPNPDSQRNPIGLFLLQARRALADVESPVARRQAASAARAARRAAAAAAAHAERNRLAALATNPHAQARIRAAQASMREMVADARRKQRLAGQEQR